MTPEKPPPGTIPTLTEVVSWPEAVPAAPPSPAPTEVAPPEAPPAAIAPPSAAAVPFAEPESAATATLVTQAQLAQRVMADLEKQLDLMLEVRLREALAPVLARVGDALVRDARKELTAALRDVVARSVARELDRSDKS